MNLPRLQAATIGDINIDHIADISDMQVPLSIALDGCFFRPIRTAVGGNGVFFAEAAKEAGFARSFLFATVGMNPTSSGTPDLLGQVAAEWLEKRGVEPVLSLASGKSTGQVLILYQPNDRRFMVADRGANVAFTRDNLPQGIENLLMKVDFLYISGYSLLDKEQRSAIVYLAKVAREGGAFIVVDIVPHNIYQSLNFIKYREISSFADGVSVEGSTIMGFLGMPSGREPNEDEKAQIAKKLVDIYGFCLIRLNNRSDILLADRQSRQEIYVPYLNRTASLRFTDRVLANVLYAYLIHERSFAATKEWVANVTHLISPARGQK